MGGDLPEKPAAAKALTFIVQAMKDPESGNLDRIQIVKGWYENGYGEEKVFDVVWSDGRKIDSKTGKLPSVGNSVNVKEATYTNKIGDSQLQAVWTDSDFDPAQHAVYYIRVIEIPTPRWSTYDAKELGIEPLPGVPTSAYSCGNCSGDNYEPSSQSNTNSLPATFLIKCFLWLYRLHPCLSA